MWTIDEASKEISTKMVKDLPIRSQRGEMFDYEWEGWFEECCNRAIDFTQKRISVKQELPNERSKVLAFYSETGDDVELCFFMNGKFKMALPNQNTELGGAWREDLTQSITHWRPIEFK